MSATVRAFESSQLAFVTSAIERLFDGGQSLPLPVRDALLAFGDDAIAPLLVILNDESLLNSSAPGAGYAPIHALELLADLRAEQAIDGMLRILAVTDWMDIAHDRVIVRLPDLGGAVLEQALRAYQDSGDEDFRNSLCAILAKLRIRDPRILELLLEHLERDVAGRVRRRASVAISLASAGRM